MTWLHSSITSWNGKSIKTANTENIPINTIGFRPYRSAKTPQKMDVRALPAMKEDPRERKRTKQLVRILIGWTKSDDWQKQTKKWQRAKHYPQTQHSNQCLPLSLQHGSPWPAAHICEHKVINKTTNKNLFPPTQNKTTLSPLKLLFIKEEFNVMT